MAIADTSANSTPGTRTLVICLDGSLNKFSDKGVTNLVRFASILSKSKPERQRLYYQSGVGTYDYGARLSHATTIGPEHKIASLASAQDFDDHVLDAYRWIMETYQAGDQLYVLGFSRGAYAAGCLCGLLETVGLLHQSNNQLVPAAWEVYKLKQDEVRLQKGQYFRTTFSQLVKVHFLGLWDTVGYIKGHEDPYLFPLHKGSVRYVYHAMALDERRGRFEVKRYPKPEFGVLVQPPDLTQQPEVYDSETEIHEAWFPGNHVDIGGGNDVADILLNEHFPFYVTDNADVDFNVETRLPQLSLSLVPFRWILRAAISASVPKPSAADGAPLDARPEPLLLVDDIAMARYSEVVSYSCPPCTRTSIGFSPVTGLKQAVSKLDAGDPNSVSLGALVAPDLDWYGKVRDALKETSGEDWDGAKALQGASGISGAGQQPSWDNQVGAPWVEAFTQRLPIHDQLKWTDAGGKRRTLSSIFYVIVYKLLEIRDRHWSRGRVVRPDDVLHRSALTRRRLSEITASEGVAPVYVPSAKIASGQTWGDRFVYGAEDNAFWTQ